MSERKFLPKRDHVDNRKSRNLHRIGEDPQYGYLVLDNRLSDIVSSTLQYTLKKDTYAKLRAHIQKLVGIDLLSKDNLVARPELFEQTLYSLLGPSARLIFERATGSILKEFPNMMASIDRYSDWGDYSRLVYAIKGTTDPSTQYA